MIQAFFFDLQAINSGALAPGGHRAVPGHQGRRARRRDDGRRHRLRPAPAPASRSCSRTSPSRPPRRARRYSEKLDAKAIARGKTRPRRSPTSCSPGSPRPPTPPTSRAATSSSRRSSRTRRSRHKVFAEIAHVVEPRRAARARTPRRCRSPSSRPAWTGRTTSSGCTSSRPVDKMPLVEIIKGEKTSDEALAKAFDVVQQIRKTPIVVNDSRGFYTSRVIGTHGQRGPRDARRGRRTRVARARRDAGRLPGRRRCSSATSSTWS